MVAPSEPMDRPTDPPAEEIDDILLTDNLRARFANRCTATDIRIPIPSGGRGIGNGVLVVPGWIRERAVEILFDNDEIGESDGLPSAVLHCLLKVKYDLHFLFCPSSRSSPQLPIDLRDVLVSTLLIVGGTAALPGFIPRLRASLLQLLSPPDRSTSSNSNAQSMNIDSGPLAPAPLRTPESRRVEEQLWRTKKDHPFGSLYPLASKLAILNDPTPLDGDGALKNAGVAPKWTPNLMTWVGGSLAGSENLSATDDTNADQMR